MSTSAFAPTNFKVEKTLRYSSALVILDLTKQLDMEKKKNEKNKENLNKLEEEHKELKKVRDEVFDQVFYTRLELNVFHSLYFLRRPTIRLMRKTRVTKQN